MPSSPRSSWASFGGVRRAPHSDKLARRNTHVCLSSTTIMLGHTEYIRGLGSDCCIWHERERLCVPERGGAAMQVGEGVMRLAQAVPQNHAPPLQHIPSNSLLSHSRYMCGTIGLLCQDLAQKYVPQACEDMMQDGRFHFCATQASHTAAPDNPHRFQHSAYL